MKGIGGNKTAQLQIKTGAKNEIGEVVPQWTTIQSLVGWLDLMTGDSKYTNYNAKIQESTHVFVSDYVTLNTLIRAENSRLIVDGRIYDVTLIDDPMEMHEQLEIFLRFTGG